MEFQSSAACSELLEIQPEPRHWCWSWPSIESLLRASGQRQGPGGATHAVCPSREPEGPRPERTGDGICHGGCLRVLRVWLGALDGSGWLFLPKSLDGRHPRRAKGRKQRRGERCGEENGRAEQQRSWIAGGDAVELRPYEPRGSPRARSANEHAGDRNRQAVPHDHPDDGPARGAQGHAHTDFPFPRRP